ncbi:MAG: mechanosensitive ion channel [Deltaproteobacteria bacterium]|nr:mechanosensitive ion channel [Deltaproteobacteria bacterium]
MTGMQVVSRAVVFVLCIVVAPAFAWGEPESSAAAEPGSGPVSDAERILEMQQAIESDRVRLDQLQAERRDRKANFEELTEQLKRLGAERTEKTAALDEVEADSDDAAGLREQIDGIEKDYGLIRTNADLALQAERTLGEQIGRVEEKLTQDSRALEILRGTDVPVGVPGEPAAVPGSPEEPVVPGPPGEAVARESDRPETAEQIEARSEAEQMAAQARRAEQAVVVSVERKKALREQIALAKKLIDTDEQGRDNAFEFLGKREADLEALIDSGAPSAELRAIQREIRKLHASIEQLNAGIESRTENLTGLNRQLDALQEEQLRAVEEARLKREAAEEARRRSAWLNSPVHPDNVSQWAVERGPSILALLAVIGVLFFFARIAATRLARLLVRPAHRAKDEREKRAETIALSFGGAARIIIVAVGSLMVLEEAGVDIRTVLGGAAVIGLAVAFGAQNLMRDYFSGFMILLEDQYELGDLVTIGEVTGRVERANMRTTVLRDLEGRAHFIPNGQITRVTNRTYGWSRAVFEVPIAFHEDVDRVMSLLMELAAEMRADETYRPDIVEDAVMLGVDAIADGAVVIKFMMKTKPDRMFPVRREMLRRIKNLFAQEGVAIPIPRRMIVGPPSGDAS